MVTMGVKRIISREVFTNEEPQQLPRAVAAALFLEAGDEFQFFELDGNVFVEKIWIDYGEDNNDN
jgi:hypothetical protein